MRVKLLGSKGRRKGQSRPWLRTAAVQGKKGAGSCEAHCALRDASSGGKRRSDRNTCVTSQSTGLLLQI